MDADSYLQRALARLGEDRRFYDYQQRTSSNLKLLEEYLRRLRLWMERLNMPFERWWRASDLAAEIDPQIRSSKETYQWAFQITQQRPYPYGVDLMTFENMLRWETLKQHPEIIEAHNLPDPYEPFIVLLRRGGGFFFKDEEDETPYDFRDLPHEEDILHLSAGDLSLLSRQVDWLTHDIQHLALPNTPLVSLDEAALNAIDASTPKLYGLLSDSRGAIFCGQTPNGEQYLLFKMVFKVNILIIKFSASGELIEAGEKPDSQDIDELTDVAAELGLREMRITVQKFFLPQYFFGINDMWEDILEDPSIVDEDEHNIDKERIEDWLTGRGFVLQWSRTENFLLDLEGYITST